MKHGTKPVLGALWLACAACGQPAETARPAPPAPAPAPKPLSNPEQEIRSRLATLSTLLERKDLIREDHAHAHALTKELALVVWSGRESVLAALRVAPDVVGNRPALECLERALRQKPDPGGWTSEVRDGRRVARPARDVYFLEKDTTEEIARLVLEEKDGQIRHLALIVLRTHPGNPFSGDALRLAAGTLGRLLALWDDLGAEKGPMGLTSRGLLIEVVGPYGESDPRARALLEKIVHDPGHDAELRSTALRHCCSGPITPARLAMAEALFGKERDPRVRRDAVDLVSMGFMGEAEAGVEPKAFDLLNKVASEDLAGEVRIAAGRAVLEFRRRGAVEATARILEGEKDASVRAGILWGFRWGSVFKEDREEQHAAQGLAARYFLNDPDEEVQRAAIRAYLDLIWSTLWVHDESGTSLDSRAIDSIRTMVETIRKKPLSRETKAFIKEKLEKDFEKRIPELAASGDYAELKRYLEK